MLALIAGEGTLPGAVARAQAEPPLVCALRGHPPAGLTPDLDVRLETLGGLIAMLLNIMLSIWTARGGPICSPLATSHRRMVTSSLPETSVAPSGLNATLDISDVWPTRG